MEGLTCHLFPFKSYMGTIAQGVLRRQDEIRCFPTGKEPAEGDRSSLGWLKDGILGAVLCCTWVRGPNRQEDLTADGNMVQWLQLSKRRSQCLGPCAVTGQREENELFFRGIKSPSCDRPSTGVRAAKRLAG